MGCAGWYHLPQSVQENGVGMIMKKLLLGSAAVAALFAAGPGMAADLKPAPAPVYTKAPMMAPLYDWTGFYIGGRGVYSWTHTDSTTTDIPTGVAFAPTSEDRSAAHGGGQIGFDYMTSSRIVFGVVADVISGSSNTTTTSNAAGTLVSTGKTNESGSVRGRVGYAFDTLLLYGTGGWAWSNGSSTRTQVVGTVNLATPGTVETVSTSHSGWTAGAGLDYAFAPNWDVFAEYRYTNFQALSVTHPLAARSTNSTTTANSIAAGLNYRFNWGMAKY
jgi:outer membrane immunogenic protein